MDAPTDGICSAVSARAQPTALELYVLLDSSASMLEATAAGPTKWAAVTSALSAFFSEQASAGISVALKYFPTVQAGAPATCTADAQCGSFGPCERRKTCVQNTASTIAIAPLCIDAAACGAQQTCSLIKSCGAGTYCAAGPSAPAGACSGCTDLAGYCHGRDVCAAATYATPDVALTVLPSNALTGSLAAQSPTGYTPTGPAVAGALAFARQRLAASPSKRIALLLVTDGLPGGFIPGFPPAECSPADIGGIGSILAGPQGSAGTPPVSTFVLGVFAPAEATIAQSNLDMLATAGGTAPAVVVDTGQNVSPPFLTALERVRSKATGCEYELPTGAIDLGKLNVQLTTGAGASRLLGRVASEAACTSAGGWTYDLFTAVGTPTAIHLCPATCQQVQADADAHVDIVLGCPTITTP